MCLYYSENVDWAAQNLQLGRMPSAGHGFDIAGLRLHFYLRKAFVAE